MNCVTSGLIGIGLLGASLSTMAISKEETEHLRKALSPEKAALYESIVKERRSLYLQGLGIGLILSIVFLRVFRTSSWFHRAMVALAVTLLVTVIYYTAMPKSDYMLRHLNSAEENKAWLRVYQRMKQRYLYGMLGGIVAAVPLTTMLC